MGMGRVAALVLGTLTLPLLWSAAGRSAPASAPAKGAAAQIIDRPIRFDEERIQLTREYIKKHYGLEVSHIRIVPKAVVIHWTGGSSLAGTWKAFDRVRLRTSRKHLVRGGALNLSAHFLVARDGTIYRLMPENWMARHCIGLNYDSIGIENVGDARRPLTRKQLLANEALVRHLAARHPIRYLLGHMEWKRFENAPFFRELDPTYRNAKADPGRPFMRALRARLGDLKLLESYKATH